MGCGTAFLKILLSALNILFLICGICMLIAGIVFLVDPSILAYLNIADLTGDGDLSTNIAIVTIVIGSIMTVLCFFGACGACCGNSCMLYTYCILLGVTICLEFAFGIFILVEKDWIADQLEDGMNDFVQNEYLGASENEISKSWDRLHIDMKCCGVNGPTEWQTSRWFNTTDTEGYKWPKTCCVLTNDDPENPNVRDPDGCKAGNSEELYDKGCYDDLSDWLETWNFAIALSVMLYAVTQLTLIGFGCCLISGIKRDQTGYMV